jgi:hypothetical protein
MEWTVYMAWACCIKEYDKWMKFLLCDRRWDRQLLQWTAADMVCQTLEARRSIEADWPLLRLLDPEKELSK